MWWQGASCIYIYICHMYTITFNKSIWNKLLYASLYIVDPFEDTGSLKQALRLLKGHVVKRNTYAPVWYKFGSVHIYDSFHFLWNIMCCLRQVTCSPFDLFLGVSKCEMSYHDLARTWYFSVLVCTTANWFTVFALWYLFICRIHWTKECNMHNSKSWRIIWCKKSSCRDWEKIQQLVSLA